MKKWQRTRGAALIISLWALLLLAAAITVWVEFLDARMVMQAEANRALEARAAAISGVTIGMHPLVQPGSELLHANRGPDDQGFEATLIGEAGKLHLNWLLEGEQPARIELLRQYLLRMGLNLQQCTRLIDCMLDWVDPDSISHVNGLETRPDYRPANRPFVSIEEVERVRGSEPLTSKAGWKDGFTLWGKGPLDLRYAGQPAIASLPGVGDAKAANFIRYRRGADKCDFTKDDPPLQGGLAAVLSFLGFAPNRQQGLESLVTLDEPIFSIVSVGCSGKVQRRIEAVVRKGNGPSNILSWKEL